MGVYTRFKKKADGFRELVELLETTPPSRRQKMIDIGLQEDRRLTEKALQFVFSFEDILQLPPLELTEVLSETPGRWIGIALFSLPPEQQQAVLAKVAQPKTIAEIRETLSSQPPTSLEIKGAQMKLIETARKLEKKGILKSKRIPLWGEQD